MIRCRLKLYITGHSPRSELALRNLRQICDRAFDGNYELEVVDVLEQPQRAEEDKVIATPTLIRVAPPPQRRIIGDLSERVMVLRGLGLWDPDLEATQGDR
ncbi:MAG: circadian clock KaiB family protein [Fimbriimonadaceae bacterium]|nr:circadian clock KaiB family protein [Fimbriimonadaceae bacterium]